MVREFCTALGTLVLLGLSAQNDTIFPNVSAELIFEWPCKEPGTGWYWYTYTHTFQTEPTVLMDGLEWGTLDPGNPTALITVVGDQVLYYGVDGSYVPPGSTTVLYDFGLSVGDAAYWDDYYTNDYVSVVEIDTLEVVGRERRHFTLTNGDRWLEGIGSLMGLFRPFYTVPLGCADPIYSFCADYIDDEGVAYSICSEDLPLGQSMQGVEAAKVHPNPSNDRYTITTTSASGSYRVVDARGSEIRRGLLQGNETVVDLTAATPGLYILEVNGHRTKLIIE